MQEPHTAKFLQNTLSKDRFVVDQAKHTGLEMYSPYSKSHQENVLAISALD